MARRELLRTPRSCLGVTLLVTLLIGVVLLWRKSSVARVAAIVERVPWSRNAPLSPSLKGAATGTRSRKLSLLRGPTALTHHRSRP